MIILPDLGMELKNLSANWRKLQESLKKDGVSTPGSRKIHDRVQQSAAKRERTSSSSLVISKSSEGQRKFKRRKTSTRFTTDVAGVADEVQEKPILNRHPQGRGFIVSREVMESQGGGGAKVNEGLSPTSASFRPF